ncbi:4762_t:CDS:2 [Ambispora gerdemannii]|uniref:4762_t:CDS:1 n=1 Tax=Ambispora gerdemannii TaxID=144530 RepID=A0A9N9F609_9GLOM|nr:4762_t:CDS:2 [Ambispora gerdemannii]
MSFTDDIINEDYALALEGHMSKETFNNRIQSFNETLKQTSNPQMMQLFCVLITANVIVFPVLFVVIFVCTKPDIQEPLMTIMLAALGTCLFLFMLRNLYGKRYLTVQMREVERKLREFNLMDNLNYVNWTAHFDTKSILEKVLILEIYTSDASTTTTLVRFPEMAYDSICDSNSEASVSTLTIDSSPPRSHDNYHESSRIAGLPPTYDVAVNFPPPSYV